MTPTQIAARCTAVLAQNRTRLVPTLLAVFLMTQAFMVLVLAVCIGFVFFAKSVSFLAVFALFFAMILFTVITNYGFSRIMLKFSRGEQTVIGHLLSGFLCIKRLCAPSLVQLVLYLIPIFALAFLQGEAIAAAPTAGLLSEAQVFATLCVLFVGALLSVPFLFVPFMLIDNPYARVTPFFKQSARLMCKNFGFIFVSVIKSLWKLLLTEGALIVVAIVLSTVLSEVLSLASSVVGYLLYAKFTLALSLCYNELCRAPLEAVSEELRIEAPPCDKEEA